MEWYCHDIQSFDMCVSTAPHANYFYTFCSFGDSVENHQIYKPPTCSLDYTEPNEINSLHILLHLTKRVEQLSVYMYRFAITNAYSEQKMIVVYILTVQDGATPLFIASQHGHTDVVDVLIKAKANVNQPMKVNTCER